MSFWEILLLFFTFSGAIIVTALLGKGKIGLLPEKLLLLFVFLFAYGAFLTFFSWKIPNERFGGLLAISHLVPLVLYGLLIYALGFKPKKLTIKSNGQTGTDHKQNKYEKTGLSESFSLELKSKLEELMTTKKLFLKHELKLDDIAELLDVSRHHASQVINENFQMSFYDYINAYRIEEAKRKLCSGFEKSPESISDIAYQCGFNNRVSFYKAFKKMTRSTPSEYLAKVV